jgi:hypothetical protein
VKSNRIQGFLIFLFSGIFKFFFIFYFCHTYYWSSNTCRVRFSYGGQYCSGLCLEIRQSAMFMATGKWL